MGVTSQGFLVSEGLLAPHWPDPGNRGHTARATLSLPGALALTPPSSCPSGLLCLPLGGQPVAQHSSPSALCSRPRILNRGENEDKNLSLIKEETKRDPVVGPFHKGN